MIHSLTLVSLIPFLASGLQDPGTTQKETPVHLIAHRGGVVTESIIENSLPAIEEAVRRGYWMIEVDIQESADGELVAHHDATFQRYYGDRRRLTEMTWEEIDELRSDPGHHRPLTFDEFTKACGGRIRLMLDTKGADHPTQFFERMESSLRENNLLKSAYVIGTAQSKEFFSGKARIGANRLELKAALEAGEDVSRHYFLFEHGRILDQETVAWAQSLGVPVVPSINAFHYFGLDAPLQAAESDTRKLLKLGVKEFQIDSIYDSYFADPTNP